MKIFFLLVLLLSNLFATQRIITLSPSLNEIVFALGKGDDIVGNTDFCKYPKESLQVPKVGGYFSPSLEKILSLNPSIVIMQKNNHKLNQKLLKLGVKTHIVNIDTLESIKNSIASIGHILGATQKANAILKNINKELALLKNIVTNKKVLIVIGHNISLASRIFIAGQNLYFDDIIQASGNVNAFQSDRKGQPILNMENIIATNADIVILLAPFMKQKALTPQDLIAPWKALPINASKKDNIFIIDKEYAGIPSDRIIYFLQDFQKILIASR